MSELDTSQFLAGYLAEAHDHLGAARTNLLAAEDALRRREAAPRPVRELFRSLHTLKGLSAMIGAEPVADVAHAMETVLRNADRAGGALPLEAIDVLAGGLRAIEDRVARLGRGEPLEAAPAALIAAIDALHLPGGPADASDRLDLPPELEAKLAPGERGQLAAAVRAGRQARRVDFVPSPARAERGLNITAVRERVAALGEIVKVLPRAAAPGEDAPAGLAFVLLVLGDALDEALAAAADAPATAVTPIALAGPAPAAPGTEVPAPDDVPVRHGFVRVDVARLDDALEHVSALVVSRAHLARAVEALAASGADVRAARSLLDEHRRQLRALRSAVMRARLVPVADVLERAPLLVRGLARATGKQVRLSVEAGAAEVDKAVGERLFPAIVHLLRNAVDHALETPAERRRAGKPEEGQLRVTARERADTDLELEVADDGRGIDVEAVARRAGVPVPATPAELLELISRPGLSTLDEATRTSGRGLGMDIVRRIAVSDLGGSLEVRTERGVGTTFALRVPLSLTIVDGLTLTSGSETFVVPIAAVHDLVELDPGDLVATPESARSGPLVRLLRHRSGRVPYVRLDAALGLAEDAAPPRKAVVIERDRQAFAFGVARLLGRQEVVIRPMADPLVRATGVSGSTDLGDGRATLVLDLAALIPALRAAAAPEVR